MSQLLPVKFRAFTLNSRSSHTIQINLVEKLEGMCYYKGTGRETQALHLAGLSHSQRYTTVNMVEETLLLQHLLG